MSVGCLLVIDIYINVYSWVSNRLVVIIGIGVILEFCLNIH